MHFFFALLGTKRRRKVDIVKKRKNGRRERGGKVEGNGGKWRKTRVRKGGVIMRGRDD